ncbi:MAG: putative esterase/lipase [Bacteroidetes bacterium OLB12]|nr:MAG: putative esterase/lipase [Bacteroidetes bacterium OLB12]HNR73225.1 alpha/beta hydrolase [Cyclobacteriaceae bacterium]HNU41109.1 alpha/beta hydrolase [Cyclobacteriaceae bacterium]
MQKELHFEFKARYFTSGAITTQTRNIWFVLHGYGQLAQYFIRKFEILKPPETVVIAPEGLSRFYLQDVNTRVQSGNAKVGATWMTRENRLTDIENYLNFLCKLYRTEIPNDYTGHITILGFSQGAATASRWATDSRIRFNRLILWAGVFPPDMNLEQAGSLLQRKEVLQVYGTNDPFMNELRLAEMQQINARLGVTPRVITFTGKHEINTEVLKQISEGN